MLFDLNKIPFSMPGSYMAISNHEANFRGMTNSKGYYIRSIHQKIATPFIAKLDFLYKGKSAKYSYSAAPELLEFSYKQAEIKICFADCDTLLFNCDSEDGAIELDFLPVYGNCDYIFEIQNDKKADYVVNSFKNNRQYLLRILKGSTKVTHDWDGHSSEHIIVKIAAQDDGFSFALREIETNLDINIPIMDFETSVKERQKSFNDFYQSMPTVPNEFENTRKMASYINWSCIVRKTGKLTRDAMYMSKNWMCSLWSWDHCFNAIALAYNNPKEAWDQFMILFDYQDSYGKLPDAINDTFETWNFCKPPIHGWALSKMMKLMRLTTEQKHQAYEHLSRWTDWWYQYRDYDQDGICEYHHGNDSGWDNATVFKEVPPVELPELQAFLIIQMEVLSQLAEDLGMKDASKDYKRKADCALKNMLTHCFRDSLPVALTSGNHKTIHNDSLILYESLILGKRLPEKIRDNMIMVLKSDKFLTEYGYATESPKSSDYRSDGYWRGPIWAPSTMILLDALYECGEIELVKKITRKFSEMVEKSGCAENFNALTGEGLRDRAYTWTASAFLIMAHEHIL